MAITRGDEVHIASPCVYTCFRISGASVLHSDILERDVFHDTYARTPDKFTNVINSINHRHWLSKCSPELDVPIRDCCGKDKHPFRPDVLKELGQYRDDAGVFSRLGRIKADNKEALAAWVAWESGAILNTDASFDVQVKRLHEYKRQLLDVLHIIHFYQRIKADPHFNFTPRIYLLDAKTAPGYTMAKWIIRLINSMAGMIVRDPACKDRFQVVFPEDYQMSPTEKLMPVGELPGQISTAGKEVSSTDNMKFAINGAVVIDTLDGTNVGMHQVLGGENIFPFSLKAYEVAEVKQKGYESYKHYVRNPELHAVIDRLNVGFDDGTTYGDITRRFLFGDGGPADEYLPLTDLESYRDAHRRAGLAYQDPKRWNQMALMNIARFDIFAVNHSIRDYARDIWNVPVRVLK